MKFKLENANEIIMQIPKIAYGYIDNSLIIEQLNESLQDKKVTVENIIIYTQEILEDVIDWINENLAIEFDPFKLPSFMCSYSIGTEKQEIHIKDNQYYKYIKIFADIATNITFLNMICDCYEGIGDKVHKHLINNEGLINVLLDINMCGLQQGRDNLIQFEDLTGCEYIVL